MISQLFDFYIYCRGDLQTPVSSNRESLYGLILKNIDENPSKSWAFLEFGVAWGYTTNYFSSRLDQKRVQYAYYGFDTFQGLPNRWREFEKGSFSAHGEKPKGISDNVEFLVGYVEETLPKFIDNHFQPRTKKEGLVILFDLDLLSPTRFCFDLILPFLSPGDILYFDEAFDFCERSIILEIMKENTEFEVMGASLQALLIRKKNL